MLGVDVVDCVAAIMFKGGANIPAVMAVRCPCVVLVRFIVGNDFDSGWCHGCCCEVKASI